MWLFEKWVDFQKCVDGLLEKVKKKNVTNTRFYGKSNNRKVFSYYKFENKSNGKSHEIGDSAIS